MAFNATGYGRTTPPVPWHGPGFGLPRAGLWGAAGGSTSPGGSITVGGYTPNYQDLLNNDPGYQATHQAGINSIARAASARDAAIKALQYGYNGSELSTLSGLRRQQDQDSLSSLHSLAARGALHSGEKPWEAEQIQHNFDQGNYNAQQTLEQGIQNALNAYLGISDQVTSQDAQAGVDASQRLANDPLYQPTQGQSATLVPDWQTYGQPIYSAGGKYYTQDGKPWTGPQPHSPGYGGGW